MVQVCTERGQWLAVDTGSAGTVFSGDRGPRGARCCSTLTRFDDEVLQLRRVRAGLGLRLAAGGVQRLPPHELQYSEKKYTTEADGFLGRASLAGRVLVLDPHTPRVSIT